jgi:hypothetical protein
MNLRAVFPRWCLRYHHNPAPALACRLATITTSFPILLCGKLDDSPSSNDEYHDCNDDAYRNIEHCRHRTSTHVYRSVLQRPASGATHCGFSHGVPSGCIGPSARTPHHFWTLARQAVLIGAG